MNPSLSNQFTLGLAVALAALITGCGQWAAAPPTRGDVAIAADSEHHLNASNLRSQDFPTLARFTQLYEIDFDNDGGTDEKLDALARVGFTNLAEVIITDCPEVTDRGIVSLSRIPSLTGLGLGRVSITDAGMRTLATGFPHLTEINIERCRLLTVEGVMTLTNSRTITDVSLSLDPFSPEQVVTIISNVPNVTRWTISDPHQLLDRAALRRLGDSRKITILVADEKNSVTRITKPQPEHTAIQTGAGPGPTLNYPKEARELGWEGTAVLRVVVGADGRPTSVAVAQSSGHGILDDAARDYVAKWIFPPERTGTNVVPINFTLAK